MEKPIGADSRTKKVVRQAMLLTEGKGIESAELFINEEKLGFVISLFGTVNLQEAVDVPIFVLPEYVSRVILQV